MPNICALQFKRWTADWQKIRPEYSLPSAILLTQWTADTTHLCLGEQGEEEVCQSWRQHRARYLPPSPSSATFTLLSLHLQPDCATHLSLQVSISKGYFQNSTFSTCVPGRLICTIHYLPLKRDLPNGTSYYYVLFTGLSPSPHMT